MGGLGGSIFDAWFDRLCHFLLALAATTYTVHVDASLLVQQRHAQSCLADNNSSYHRRDRVEIFLLGCM